MVTITLYRPTGQNELACVAETGFTKWPPRLVGQPIFYPVANEEYAIEIAQKWNTQGGKTGYVTRFQVRKSFMNKYALHQVGAKHHLEYWIPAVDLDELNKNIVGKIEVIRTYPETASAETK